MISTDNISGLMGAAVIDSDGEKIGTLEQIYLDTDTGAPTWAAVRTGFFGTSESFVPIDDANQDGENLRVSYAKEFVKNAPRIDADGALEHAQEDELYVYYGNGSRNTNATEGTGTVRDASDRAVDTSTGYDTSGPTTDDAMTRSEERLRVGTEKVQTGRARLRKYVVTEEKTVTVPVSHEEVRLEREPITDANVADAMDGPAISEEEHEVVLTEERPVVAKETVPVERVRLGTETVTEEETVTDQVRKEQIDYDDGTNRTDRA